MSNIDVANDVGTRDAAEAHAVDLVQLVDGRSAGFAKDTAEIDEGRNFDVEFGANRVDRKYPVAQLDAGRKRIAIVESPRAKTAQRLLAANLTLAAADAAERPKRHLPGARQVAQRHVRDHFGVGAHRPETAAVHAVLAVR